MLTPTYRHIVTVPGVRSGQPIVEGSRIGAHDVVALRAYPDLTRAQAYECPSYHEDHKADMDLRIARPPRNAMHSGSASVDLEREKYYELLLREIVLRNSSEFQCEVFLFGSRARGEVRRASDFDIGIRGLAQAGFRLVKRRIEEEVEESIIPHGVDVVDFDRAGERFGAEALRGITVWKSVSAT